MVAKTVGLIMKHNRFGEEQITHILRDAKRGDKTIGQVS